MINFIFWIINLNYICIIAFNNFIVAIFIIVVNYIWIIMAWIKGATVTDYCIKLFVQGRILIFEYGQQIIIIYVIFRIIIIICKYISQIYILIIF